MGKQEVWTACAALINSGASSNPLCALSNKRWKKSSVYLPKSSILELCQNCSEDKEILTTEEAREETRLIALDQQRLDELFGPNMEAYLAINKGSEEIDEETARLIAVEWMSTVEPNDKSDLLQDMENLDVAVLITSNIDCDLKRKVPHESDFQIGQHRN